MHNDEQLPTPPAPKIPPAPTGAPAAPIEPPAKPTDNPIAVAGIVVALLALILSIIVVGGLLAFVSFTLCIVGLRRSKTLQRGRGLAITGIVLSVLSLVVAAIALVIIIVSINGGDEIIRNGIVTTSTNTEFPPQDDLVSVECSASDSGDLPLAIITLENKSTGRSVYGVTVQWDTPTGVVEGEVNSDFVDAGDTVVLRLFDRSSTGIIDDCRVTRIERSGFRLLG